MSLQVWLPLTGDANNQGLCGNSLTTSGVTFSDGGKLGGKYLSAGTITIPAAVSKTFFNNNNMSFAFWLYPIGTTSGAIMGKQSMGAGDNRMYTIFQYSTANDLHLSWQNNTETNTVFLGGRWSDFFPADTWTHCCITYDGAKAIIYKNGIQYTIVNGVSNRTSFEYDYPIFGGSNRRLQDVRIYDECLSPKQVKLLSQGLALHYTLSRVGGDNLALNSADLTLWAKESGMTCEWDSTEQMYKIDTTTRTSSRWGIYQDFNCEANTAYTFSVEGKKVEKAMYLSVGSYKDTATWPGNQTQFTTTRKRLSYTFTTGADHNKIRMYLAVYPTAEGSNAAYYAFPKLEKSDHVTPWLPNSTDTAYTKVGFNDGIEYDVSGFGNNGMRTGTFTWSSDTPKYTTSMYMPKAALITHPRPVDGSTNQEWTCAMWVKLDNTSQATQRLNNFNSGNNIIYSANGVPLLYLNGGADDYYNYGNKAVVANVWTHIAFVFRNSDGTKLIYINGIEQTNKNGPNKTSTPSGIPNTVTVGTNLAGYISDYRIYATALSADDILELYNTPVHLTSNGALLTSGELTEV